LGELAFGVAHPFAGGPQAGALAFPRRGAGGDFEQPELLGGQRGLLVGVVLLAGEQAPGQARELAGAAATTAFPWPRRARIRS
jgi:hypothetical protein